MCKKCASIDCDNTVDTNSIWCESCLLELGEIIEKSSIGYVPRKFKP